MLTASPAQAQGDDDDHHHHRAAGTTTGAADGDGADTAPPFTVGSVDVVAGGEGRGSVCYI